MELLRERMLTAQKLTVVCAGDSQVWGQGAAGWKQAMPDFVAPKVRSTVELAAEFNLGSIVFRIHTDPLFTMSE